MKVGEAASRVVVPVYHTGQGQDERARTRPFHLLRGLDLRKWVHSFSGPGVVVELALGMPVK